MAVKKFTPMTGNRFLLDTNIVSAWLKGEAIIANNIDKADAIYIPIIVIGELYYGASFSVQIQKNTENIKRVTQRYPVLSIDEETTISYGNIKANLRKKGKPIPENDIWIAAIALTHHIPLVTRDKHFTEIEDILLEEW